MGPLIGVVGGGLAGLVAAYELTRAGNPVILIERASRLGGQVWTESVGGFLIEHGAEGYAAGRRSATQLVADLGLTGRLVSQMTTSSMILRSGLLEVVPVSEAARLTGIQADRADFGQGIASFKGGAGELVGALLAALTHRATILLGAGAVHLAPKAGGWRLTTGQRDTTEVDAVILAVPAAAAAGLVAPISRPAAELLESFQAVSSVSVSLACPASAVRLPPEAGGFVSAPGSEQEGFRACDFSSAKFPGRAPSGFVLLRAFFRPGRECPLDAPDSRWVQLAVDAVWPALGIRERPACTWVARWRRALPRYAPDHEESLRTLARLLGGGPPLELAGAAYRASGIAGALESARAAARGLVVESA
jgi:oxygen-dependent protoporphyrinogen oxidase